MPVRFGSTARFIPPAPPVVNPPRIPSARSLEGLGSTTAEAREIIGLLVGRLGIPESSSSTLSAQSSLTAAATVIKAADTSLSGQSSLTAAATVVKVADTTLSAQSSLTAAVNLTLGGAAALSGQSSLTADAALTTFGAAALTGQSSLAADATLISSSGPTAFLSASSNLIPTFRNLLLNPSFQFDLNHWTISAAGDTNTRITTDSLFGPSCLEVTKGGGVNSGTRTLATQSPVVNPGDVMTGSVYVKVPTGQENTNVRVFITWLRADLVTTNGNAIPSGTVVTSASGWTQITVTGTAPALTAGMLMTVGTVGAETTGQKYLVDGAMFTRFVVPPRYFDGANGGTWLGTAHGSNSDMEVFAIRMATASLSGQSNLVAAANVFTTAAAQPMSSETSLLAAATTTQYPTAVLGQDSRLRADPTHLRYVITFASPYESVKAGRKKDPRGWWVTERRGVSLLKESGSWNLVVMPDPERVAAAERAYLGGRDYQITTTERDELIAAGFGSQITEAFV